MRRRSKVAVTVALTIVVALAVPVVLLLTVPMVYSSLVERSARAAAGVELEYRDMTVSLFPAHVAVSALQLKNPDPSFEAPLLVADHISATAWIGDWWRGDPTWWKASAGQVDVRLEKNAQGVSNWQVGERREREPGRGPGALMDFSSVEVRDLSIIRLAQTAHRFQVSRLHVEQMADERLRIELDGSYRDQPLRASGTLALPSSEQAREVAFQANVFGGTLNVDGRVGHDGVTPGRATIAAEFRDLSAISTLLDRNLSFVEPLVVHGVLAAPELGRWRVDATGTLAGRDLEIETDLTTASQRYRIHGARVGFGQSEVRGAGVLDMQQRNLQARIDARRLAVDELLIVPPGSSSTAGSAAGPRNGPVLEVPAFVADWSYDVDLEAERIDYQGWQMSGLAAALNSEPQAVVVEARLQNLVSGAGKQSWRVVEPVSTRGRLRLPGRQPDAAAGFSLELSTVGFDGNVEVTLPAASGQVPRIGIRGELASLAAVEGTGLDKATYDDLLPLTLDMEARRGGRAWQLGLTAAGVAGTELSGDLSIDPAATPVAVRGALHSPEIDLNSIPTTSGAQQGQGGSQETATPPGGMIPDEPLDWSWLEQANVNVEAAVDKLSFNHTTFRSVRTSVVLNDGQLRVEPITADLSQGGVRGHVTLARQEQGARLDGRLAVSQLVPADLGQRNAGLIDGGATDLVVDVTAHGRSPQDLAGSLNGELVMEVQRAVVRNNLFERVTGDVLIQTLRLINPFIDQDPQTDLECAALHVVADDGVLTSPNRLVLETSKVVIRAGGTIDLNDESLKLDFVPSPRQGLGISIGGLAELVRITGTLSEPRTTADPSAVLKGGATVGAAIATGGLSLLAQGLFARARNAGTECGQIFEEQTDLRESLQVSEDSAEKSGDDE